MLQLWAHIPHAGGHLAYFDIEIYWQDWNVAAALSAPKRKCFRPRSLNYVKARSLLQINWVLARKSYWISHRAPV